MKPSEFSLETKRLQLYIIDNSRVEDVFKTMNFRETAEMISFLKWPMTKDQAEAWCRKAIAGISKEKEFLYIAYEKHHGHAIGCICLLLEDNLSMAEIGYWVANPWQRKGLASEMIQAMLGLGFSKLGLKSLLAKIALNNPSSLGAIQKFGFRPIGEEMKPTAKGTDIKLVIYELKN